MFLIIYNQLAGVDIEINCMGGTYSSSLKSVGLKTHIAIEVLVTLSQFGCRHNLTQR